MKSQLYAWTDNLHTFVDHRPSPEALLWLGQTLILVDQDKVF
ncbi:hypothetical protein [Acinetobacter lwoffii]